LLHSFPSWFVGVAFAAIGIGALVPAAIMSIAAADLYTRNIHREFINRNPTDKQESRMAASRCRWNARLSPRNPRLSQNGNMQP
jgi:Na+/proline symporter